MGFRILPFAFAIFVSFSVLAADDGKAVPKEADKDEKVLSACDNLKNPTSLPFKVFVDKIERGNTEFMLEGGNGTPGKVQRVRVTFETDYEGYITVHDRCEIWNGNTLVEASASSNGKGVCGHTVTDGTCTAKVRNAGNKLEWVFGGPENDDPSKGIFWTLWKSPKAESYRAIDLANPKENLPVRVKKISGKKNGEKFCVAGDTPFYLEYGENKFLKKACQLKKIILPKYITEYVEAKGNPADARQDGDCKAKLEMCEKLFAR